MKYLKLFKENIESEKIKDINKICSFYGINTYTINPDGTIDVDGDVSFSYLDRCSLGYRHYGKLYELPLKFNKINGNFNCYQNSLTSFEGSPIEVNGHFCYSHNQLTSFQYAPKIIRGNFWCNDNKIKTFEYFPSYVKGGFHCKDTPIFEVWKLFADTTKIELLNDCDIFRNEDTDTPAIIIDRLNDFLLTIGKKKVKFVYKYKNI